MPRTEQQNREAREASRDRIVETALALFARHGYERTSVRMIARDAGIAQGLLYNYFESKEDLLRAIFERNMADVRASFAAASEGGDPRARLERLIRGAFAIVARNRAFWTLSYALRMQPAVLEGLGADVGGWTLSIRGTLESLLRDAGFRDPATEAAILHALIDGAAQHYTLEPERYPLEPVVAAIVARYAQHERGSPEGRSLHVVPDAAGDR